MKRIKDKNFVVFENTLAEEEKAKLRKEEKVHNIFLRPPPLDLQFTNNCTNIVNGSDNLITKTSVKNGFNANVLSSTSLPMSGKFKVTVTVLKTHVRFIYCGVAPSSFNINGGYMYDVSGWHFRLNAGSLDSGPPTSYKKKSYARGVKEGEYVDIVVDREERTISFAVNGEDQGVAYKDVFNNGDDLRLCVMLYSENDSVRIGPIEAV
eukprot:m.37796 g.37796  ORF g.37796 m.37796 type:complete len:208 (-) comp10157_c0_seq1:1086-1709(-)